MWPLLRRSTPNLLFLKEHSVGQWKDNRWLKTTITAKHTYLFYCCHFRAHCFRPKYSRLFGHFKRETNCDIKCFFAYWSTVCQCFGSPGDGDTDTPPNETRRKKSGKQNMTWEVTLKRIIIKLITVFLFKLAMFPLIMGLEDKNGLKYFCFCLIQLLRSTSIMMFTHKAITPQLF